MNRSWLALIVFALVALVACSSAEPSLTTRTFIPVATLTASPAPNAASCADLDLSWSAQNWQAALALLTQLEVSGIHCGIESLASKRYAVLINLAAGLESQNDREGAVARYREALTLDGQRQEALRALLRLDALPDATPAPCAPQALASYPAVPDRIGFAKTVGDEIVFDGKPFLVRGVNYYPRNAPWQGFISHGDLGEIERELDLIATRGFNTVRIFLWYDALFQCAPERAVPDVAAFNRLDAILTMARERDLHLIVTLNDLPDFYFRPIYTDWAHYDARTAFIVARYRDEPMILAWDVRNEGDIDYGVTGAGMPGTTRAQVLTWLEHITTLVRSTDRNHLVMAGWYKDPVETASYVDILSLHHWSTEAGLRDRIDGVRQASAKPVLVEEMGLSAMGPGGEAEQARQLARMVETVESSTSAGWLIWTAFDFFALPDSIASPEYRFGIWRNDLSPKPAIDRLPIPTRSH